MSEEIIEPEGPVIADEVVSMVLMQPPFRVDEPTKNGRIYPRAVFEQAIADWRGPVKNPWESNGTVQYGMYTPDVSTTLVLSEVSHRCSDIRLRNDGTIDCIITFLATPQGKIAQEAYEQDLVVLNFIMRGKVDENGVVSDLAIDRVNLINATDYNGPSE